MRVFRELEEVETMQDNVKDMSDIILDSYKKHPKECEKLLKELNSINNEFLIGRCYKTSCNCL